MEKFGTLIYCWLEFTAAMENSLIFPQKVKHRYITT